ncbi:hypothetical protein AGLY_007100 [Aphis glycines]|uniref:TTF-type domain-containing protein n=1 Tax=Aphis glycines TaxID=307491 RepID=A0A6G0TP65_APHGL|nr:hypothetical protein AGLY_007100 [Aphis glycines]
MISLLRQLKPSTPRRRKNSQEGSQTAVKKPTSITNSEHRSRTDGIHLASTSQDLKNTPNIALQNNESNNEVLNKQIFGDADDPVNEIPVSRLEKKDKIDKGPYQPKFDFPRTIIGSKYRSFQIEWYNKYSWLEHSKVLDSAFCFYCHEQKEVFISKQNQVKIKNRQIMERLIDIVICLAKGGRPFRGHDGSKISIARGLFLDLESKYDPTLKDHLTNGPQNALYTSGKIQNDIITSISNIILRKISHSVQNKLVSIMADETSDCGHHEQIAIVLRFFDDKLNSPVEHLVAIRRLTSVDTQAIFNELKVVLSELKVNWKNVLSVCFDGVAAMSESVSGVQMRCKELNRNIELFTTHTTFEKISSEIGSTLRILKSLSTTRWACRAEAVAVIKINYSAILRALTEIIETTKHSDIKVKEIGLLHQVKSFNFVFGLTMMHPILQLIVKVSKLLQSPHINLINAMASIKSLRAAFINLRNETEFLIIFKEAKNLCIELEIDIPLVKKRKVSSRFDEFAKTQHYYETKEEELRSLCFYQMLDNMVTSLDLRFQQETIKIINAVGNLLNLKLNKEEAAVLEEKFKISQDELMAEIRLLKEDQTVLTGNPATTSSGWIQWMQENKKYKIYTAFNAAIQTFSVIPVTSYSCERAFSKLTHVKTNLRSTTKQDRMESLMLLYVEQELTANVEASEVIEEFKSIVPFQRRLLL